MSGGNAVNIDKPPVEMALRIDKGFPGIRQSPVLKYPDSDLADRGLIGIGCLNVEGVEFHQIQNYKHGGSQRMGNMYLKDFFTFLVFIQLFCIFDR